MAQFPISKPFPSNASPADFVKRIKEVGWAPCTAEQLLGYAAAQFSRVESKGKAKSAIGLRRAKAQAVDEWFEAMGLPESLVTDDDFREYADGDRWVTGLGLNCSDDDYFGIIAVGAFELRPDGSFEMTTVTRQALVERWDSRIGGPTAQRLLFNTNPLEVVEAVFTDDGSLLISGFHPRVFRMNARTFSDACELTVIRDLAACPHGPKHSPDNDDGDQDDEEEDLEAEVRAGQLRGTRHGTLALNCCREWVLLPNDGRGATRFMPFTGKVCFPPSECFTDTAWCITTDDAGRGTVYRLPEPDIWATFRVNGGAIVNAIMPDHQTIVTLSASGHVQWWRLPGLPSGRDPITLSAHIELPAGATFLALLEPMSDGPPYVVIFTRYRRLTLLDPFTGAVRGETLRDNNVDRVTRSGANHVVVWDSPEDPSGYQLEPLKCVWADGVGLSEGDHGVGILPDGRMVRGAFGVIVEDPQTGEVLRDYRPE